MKDGNPDFKDEPNNILKDIHNTTRLSRFVHSYLRAAKIAKVYHAYLKARVNSKKVMLEMEQVEQGYVLGLRLLVTKFCQPMIQKKLITAEQAVDLFPGLELLLQLHESLLERMQKANISSSLRGSTSPTFPNNIMDDVFFATARPLYERYVAGYTQARQILLHSDDTGIKSFISASEHDAECAGKDFDSFLTSPVKRLPRYCMLLDSLKKYSTGAEREVVTYAHVRMSLLTQQINEFTRTRVSHDKLVQITKEVMGAQVILGEITSKYISSEITTKNNISSPKFIMEGPLTVIKARMLSEKHISAFFFLFDMFLMYTKTSSSSSAINNYKYQLIKVINIKDITSVDRRANELSLSLKDKKKPLCFLFKNDLSRDLWAKEIDKLIT